MSTTTTTTTLTSGSGSGGGKLLLCLAALASLLAAQGAIAAFPEREIDCSGVKEDAPLDRFKDICSLADTWDKSRADAMKPMERLDYLESCTCHLLHHPLVWESMMTHEIETIYHVTHQIIELKDAQEANSTSNSDELRVTKDNLIYEHDTGNVMYFWDRFTALLLATKATDKSGSELSQTFTKIYTDTYYKPEDYKILFKGEGETMNFRQDLSGSCNQLFDSFGPFLVYLNNLKQLSGNSRFTYRIVAYDENLYRLMVAFRMCQFLSLSGVVIDAEN